MAVLLDRAEYFDAGSTRFDASPVEYGLSLAREEQAGWLILLRGSQIRLYSAKPGVGVGSRGLTETFFELDLALLKEDNAGYLDLAFSATALVEDGTVKQLLEGSRDYAVGLGDRLRERIYVEAIPELAVAVAKELERLDHQESQDLARAYRITLRILFRLLFQVYAEDCGYLPYGTNDEYTKYSLKQHARSLGNPPEEMFDSRSHKTWDELQLVWGVIDTGDRNMAVPAYNGGLFLSDPDRSPDGALIARMKLDNAVVGNALRRLLVDVDSMGVPGSVDFRSLSIREFGIIYEGLLSSSLSRAEQDLTLDKKQAYVPAKAGDKVEVRTGEIYFHNTSGMRKSAGVYFTPRFAVDHLLERSLVPALDNHLKKVGELLKRGKEVGAYELFFDFRVADIAMGSGNFLVAAIDYMEFAMSAFLDDNPIPGVLAQLTRLENVARGELGDYADDYSIEQSMLLRRQIARHCIFGVDNNDVAVELAKVAVWLDTFVPGLPMSSLDHSLVCADSLAGIGTVKEALDVLDPRDKPGEVTFMTDPITISLNQAAEHLKDASNILEAKISEMADAELKRHLATEVARPAKAFFDAAVAARLGELGDLTMVEPDEIVRLAERPNVKKRIRAINPGHMAYLFPQVFLRDNPGFDVIVGNPPWKDVAGDEAMFWALRFPGLKGLTQADQEIKIKKLKQNRPDLLEEYSEELQKGEELRLLLRAGSFPGIGKGRPDLYKAFIWRFWHLIRSGGYVGVVLPYGALNARGSSQWRKTVVSNSNIVDVTTLTNTSGWIFQDVGGLEMGLVIFSKGNKSAGTVRFGGHFKNKRDWEEKPKLIHVVSTEEFISWTPYTVFPLFALSEAIHLFSKFGKITRIGDQPSARQSWRVRAHQELNSATDKPRFSFTEKSTLWPVYKGASFNLWCPDTGIYYAWADPHEISRHLHKKRLKAHRIRSSAFSEMSEEWVTDPDTLPCKHARVAFRDVTGNSASRTVIISLVPPYVVFTDKAPYLLWPYGNSGDQAYLLGVLSSMILDWYARQFINLNLAFYIFNSLPVPDADPEDPVVRRVVEISGRLAAVDERFADWAAEVGVPVGTLREEPKRSDAIYELDACVALLYGLDEDDLRIIYETFHEKKDRLSERHATVLAHFRRWREEREPL